MIVPAFAPIDVALAELCAGKMVVACDGDGPEAEASLVMAAEHVTPEAINFMARHGRGVISLALPPARCAELGLRPMVAAGGSPATTPFMVSIEAREGVTTGISAADRARTIREAVDPAATPDDLAHPGHVSVLRAQPGGVVEQAGRTEAAVDLARLAGCQAAGVTCEVMNDDGSMAQVGDLLHYCAIHALTLVSVADLVDYRHRRDQVVERVAAASLPTASFGDFTVVGYRTLADEDQHLALVKGDVTDQEDVLVLTHVDCIAGHVFHAVDCECRGQLEASLARIHAAGVGVLLFLSAGRSGGLESLGGHRPPPGPDDARVVEQMLADLGARRHVGPRSPWAPQPAERTVVLDGRGTDRTGMVTTVVAPTAWWMTSTDPSTTPTASTSSE